MTTSRPPTAVSLGTPKPRSFRVRVTDQDDLTTAAAYLQDAVVPVGDLAFLAEESRFAMVVNRFRWELPAADNDRVHTAVVFDGVTAARFKGMSRNDPHHLLNLLTIVAGEGHIDLIFSDAAAVRLSAEQIDGVIEDVGDSWPTIFRPQHRID
jgi:hypothetical protein